ncbi:MAG: glycosyltransferase family 4 protein [Acidimicrobiales bacterium]
MVRAGVPAEHSRLLRAPLRLNSSGDCTSEGCSTRDGNLFLSVGRVTRLKYIEHAIMALPHAPRARLAVIGPLVDERYHRELVLRARDLGVEERVRFLGAVSAADLVAWYSQSTAVVLCSRSEGQGLVLSEAACYGSVPILAHGASDEVAAAMRCGLLYRWGDTEELAQRLEEVMGARASFEPGLRGARAFVEAELSPSAVAAKLMGIYGELGVGV